MQWILTLIINLICSNGLAHLSGFVPINFPHSSDAFKISEQKESYLLELNGRSYIFGPGEMAPLKKIITLSTSSYGFLEALDALDLVIGGQDLKYIYSKKIDKNKIQEIGRPASLDKVIILSPDVIFSYKDGDKNISSLVDRKELKLLTIEINDHLEINPLKRMSWILVYGVLIGKFKEAQEIYKKISSDYLKIKNQNLLNKERPKVMAGSFYQGVWFAPAKKSYFASLIEDAGGEYFLEKESEGTVQLTSEEIFKAFPNIDLWLTHDLSRDRKKLFSHSELYKTLLKNHTPKIFNFTKKINENEGLDFWEQGIVRPDLILKDFALMIKNKKIKSDELYWYQEL